MNINKAKVTIRAAGRGTNRGQQINKLTKKQKRRKHTENDRSGILALDSMGQKHPPDRQSQILSSICVFRINDETMEVDH